MQGTVRKEAAESIMEGSKPFLFVPLAFALGHPRSTVHATTAVLEIEHGGGVENPKINS